MENKTWLFITRAQPGLHFGQLDGIQQAIDQWINKLLIWVGSANKEFTSENPFTYSERKQMIELSAKDLLQNIEVEVFPIPDLWDNEMWRNYILQNIPSFKYIVTGNARVQEVFKDSDKTIVPIEIRTFIKWSTIRWWLVNNDIDEVKKVVSPKTVEYLQHIHAPERLREIFNKERKTPSLVVDVVLIDEEWKLILIQRNNFPEGIALPGGFNDYGETSRIAGKREVKEETGLVIEIEKDLGTWDDPKRDPRAHNVSRAFKGKIIGGKLRSFGDEEIKRIVRVDPKDLNQIIFAFPDHKEMILAALV